MESLHLFALALQLTTVAPPQVAGPSVGDFLGYDNPPAEMVDFLGRRRLCAERAVDLPEEEWLRCADLAGEELGWRARAGADADVLRWLDKARGRFELAGRESVSLAGANSMRPQRVEHSGTDAQGRPYRLNILTGSDEGRSTRIVTSYDGGPTRSFTIDGRRFPSSTFSLCRCRSVRSGLLRALRSNSPTGMTAPIVGPRVTIGLES